MKIKDAYIRDVRCKETSYGQVASDEEKVRPQTVGVEGMRPVSGRDVKDGTYEVEAESSSSMFRIERAVLTVSEGRMSAEITLSGKGYEKLFLGTGAEAAAGDASDYVGYVENQEGKYVYTIPVDALDAPIACAAFSINKKNGMIGIFCSGREAFLRKLCWRNCRIMRHWRRKPSKNASKQ